MSTKAEYLSLPSRSTGAWPASGATAWVYGSWIEIIDKLDSGMYLFGLQFQIGVIPISLDITMQQLFEVGIGPSGSEVVKLQLPYSIRIDTGLGFVNSRGYSISFPEPMLIPAGSRISVRVTDSIAAAVSYEGVKLMYREVEDPTVVPDLPDDLAVITDRTPDSTFTGSSVEGFDLEYRIQINNKNSFSTDFQSLSQATLNWYGITIDSSNQNVYACVFGGDIYKQTAGTGNFVALGQTNRNWSAIAVDSSNQNIYGTVSGVDIYKQTAGTGSFVAMGVSTVAGIGIAVDTSNQNVYSAANGVDIYKQTAGIGSFVSQGAGALVWSSIAIDSVTHDVYACVNGGDIYKQTASTGSFVALNQVVRAWVGISIDSSNHNVYAIVNVGDLYIQYGGTGDFIAQGQFARGWSNVAVDSTTHDVYAVHYYNNIYKKADPSILIERTSTVDSGFVDVTNGANLHPFPTSEQIRHTVQSADILGPGVYYWRVAASDPLGTNYYRSWTTPRSFTLLTGPKAWSDGSWGYKPLKVWDGNSWVRKPMKIWDGSSWVVKG